MYGLTVIEGICLSGHLSNIDEIIIGKASIRVAFIFYIFFFIWFVFLCHGFTALRIFINFLSTFF